MRRRLIIFLCCFAALGLVTSLAVAWICRQTMSFYQSDLDVLQRIYPLKTSWIELHTGGRPGLFVISGLRAEPAKVRPELWRPWEAQGSGIPSAGFTLLPPNPAPTPIVIERELPFWSTPRVRDAGRGASSYGLFHAECYGWPWPALMHVTERDFGNSYSQAFDAYYGKRGNWNSPVPMLAAIRATIGTRDFDIIWIGLLLDGAVYAIAWSIIWLWLRGLIRMIASFSWRERFFAAGACAAASCVVTVAVSWSLAAWTTPGEATWRAQPNVTMLDTGWNPGYANWRVSVARSTTALVIWSGWTDNMTIEPDEQQDRALESPASLVPSYASFLLPDNDIPRSGTRSHWRLMEARGWPMPALWWRDGGTSSGLYMSYTSPPRPISASEGKHPAGIAPLGFAVNSSIAFIMPITLLMLVRVALFGRRWRRERRGCCVKCGYPIGTSPVCTECGAELPKRDATLGGASIASRR